LNSIGLPYLLDTNICIFLMRGRTGLTQRTKRERIKDLFISEVTLAEMKFGVAKSDRPLANRAHLEEFLLGVSILPVREALDVFAFEKARLYRSGQPLPDFDLLIGATAVHHSLTLVTNNTKHFQRIQGIQLEDWTQEPTS
jgi:tRNA(fMet)-specific endonuclease VapC